jgi:hypothetical protein
MDELTLQRINLLPRAQALSAGDSVFSDEERQFIAEIYKSLLGKDIPNCSCRNRYADALIEICSTFKIKTNMSKCKYQLLAGVIIWLGTECYSNHNLTDEVAEEYLRRFPEAREKEFQVWPEEEPQDKKEVEPALVPADNGEGQGEGDPDPDSSEGDNEGEGDGDNGQNQDPDPEPEPAKPSKAKKGK